MARTAIIGAVTAAVAAMASGCGERLSRDEAFALIQAVGPERIRAAAEILRRGHRAGEEEIAAESWPAAIRELKPKSVVVDNGGVMLGMTSRFVEGEAIYVVFEKARAPAEGPGDPSVVRLDVRIYLYEFVG